MPLIGNKTRIIDRIIDSKGQNYSSSPEIRDNYYNRDEVSDWRFLGGLDGKHEGGTPANTNGGIAGTALPFLFITRVEKSGGQCSTHTLLEFVHSKLLFGRLFIQTLRSSSSLGKRNNVTFGLKGWPFLGL